MRFVLDNSVVMRWLFVDGSETDRGYASHVLDRLGDLEMQATAPSIWPLEVANVIARAESEGILHEARSTRFLRLIENLDVVVDNDTALNAMGATLHLARRYRLSAYDASYLELALREAVPLATLDIALQQAANQAGVEYL